MADCRFITFHGWGFDNSFWKAWAKKLSAYGSFLNYDRGYFNEPNEIKTGVGSESTVIIIHSFGLHFVDVELLNQADLLVITGGFLHFHPYAPKYRKRSRLILNQMIDAFENKPEQVLNKFYQNCFAPDDVSFENSDDLNHRRLLDDLKLLHQSELDVKRLKKAGKICILHGAGDHIVPNNKGRELYAQLGAKAKYFEMKNAGHALPYLYPQQCLEFVEPHIEQVLETTKKD